MTLTFLTEPDAEQFSYPGGEVSVKMGGYTRITREIARLDGADSDELLRLIMWGRNVARLGGEPIALIPYLPGARADHPDQEVGYDADVYAAIINSAGFSKVICLDPHSPNMPNLIDRCVSIGPEVVFQFLVDDGWLNLQVPITGVIVPDKGARVRSREIARVLGVPTYQAGKTRDYSTGKLSGFTMEVDLPENGTYLVADDICDGGGTFAGLAGATGLPPERLHLYVTHGIFSGRAEENLEAYGSVTTTDSHPGHENIAATVIPTQPILEKYL